MITEKRIHRSRSRRRSLWRRIKKWWERVPNRRKRMLNKVLITALVSLLAVFSALAIAKLF